MPSDPDKKRKPRKPAAKADKASVMLRVDAILRLLIAGAQRHDLLQFASAPEQNWGLTARQVDTYIGKARKQLEKLAAARRSKALTRHLVQRGDLYARALAAGEIRTALAVAQDEAELLSLYPPPKKAQAEDRNKMVGTIQFVEVVLPMKRDENQSATPDSQDPALPNRQPSANGVRIE
jgi:hypothetical protein